MRLILLLILATMLVTGCALFPAEKDDETADWSAEQIYAKAKDKMDAGHYTEAVEYFEILQARFPFGVYAQQALLGLAYSYFKQEEPASSIASSDRFIKLYPTHRNIDYAYYLKGLVTFNEGKGLLQRYLPADATQRDPGAALQSFQDFSLLIRKYPESQYVADAQLRMTYLRNLLSQHEVNVAHFYMRRGAYIASANRARYVVENYQQTPAMPDALMLMAKAYKVLGMIDLSKDALRVLELNYPDHPGIDEVRKTIFTD